jgi:hypothetical protein
MEAKVHPLVELLVARAKSHPEEFVHGGPESISATSRWWYAIDVIRRDGTDADNAAMDKAIGSMAMDKAHEWAMDELMNGEQRREDQRRQAENDYKRALQAQSPTIQKLSDMQRDTQKMLNQQMRDAYGQSWNQQLQNALGNKK